MINHRITPMTESGLLAAITVIMGLIAVYIPVLGMGAAILWPLPIIVLVVRHGLRWGMMAAVTAGVVMAMLIEPIVSLRMLITFGPVSLMLGYGFRQEWPAAKILLLSLLTAVMAMLAGLALVFAVTGINPFAMQLDILKESIQASTEAYRSMGMDEAQLATTTAEFNKAMDAVALLLPLVLTASAILITYMNFWIGGRVLRRLGHPVPVLPPFAEWRLPKAFLYLFGFALVGMYWGGTREFQLLYQLSLNVNMFATCAGVLQGAAVLAFLARRARMATWLVVLILLFILFNGFFAQILAFVGLFDMLFDYRRRFSQRNSDRK